MGTAEMAKKTNDSDGDNASAHIIARKIIIYHDFETKKRQQIMPENMKTSKITGKSSIKAKFLLGRSFSHYVIMNIFVGRIFYYSRIYLKGLFQIFGSTCSVAGHHIRQGRS